MARRFGQIKKGAEYDTALDNYVAFIRDAATRPTKRMQGGTRGARRETIAASLLPFGLDMPADSFIQVRASRSSSTALSTPLTNRLSTTSAQLAKSTPVARFRPARVAAFRGSGAAAYAQSKITKLWYLKYEGDNFSAPFGALTETEEEAAGATAVKAAIMTLFSASDIKRVSFSPEKVPV